MVVRKILPSRAVGAVILAHRTPLALRQIRPPAFPVPLARPRFLEPPVLYSLNARHVVESSAKQALIFTLFDTPERRRIQASCPASHVRHSSVIVVLRRPLVYRATLVGGTFRYILEHRLMGPL